MGARGHRPPGRRRGRRRRDLDDPRTSLIDTRAVALVALLAVNSGARGQGVDARPTWQLPSGYAALHQATRDAATDTRVLLVASHPDDRYVMPAAYLRFARGWRVAVLLMTRGEGGQNSQGSEVGDELGWRRTMEAEACAARLDARVYYLNRQDAGFTRSRQETRELWGEDAALEAARLIRRIRPDVVLTTHHPEESHGHDLALLEVLTDALVIAADPRAEHARLRGLPAFSASKIFRGAAPDEETQECVELPMQEMDLVRGETYRRLAYRALELHESQAPIRPIEQLFDPTVPLVPLRPDAADDRHWTLLDGLPSLFDHVDASIERELDALQDRVGSPDKLVTAAIDLRRRLGAVSTTGDADLTTRLARRIDALDRVILHGSTFGVTAEVGDNAVAISGEPFPFKIRVHTGPRPIFRDLRLRATGAGTLSIEASAQEQLSSLRATGPFTVDATYLAPTLTRQREAWLKDRFRADTFDPPVGLEGRVTVIDPENGAALFDLEFPVVVAADIRPAVELEVIPRAILLCQGQREQKLNVRVTRRGRAPLRGRLEVLYPPGLTALGSPIAVDMTNIDYRDFVFSLRAPANLATGVYNLHVRLDEHRLVVPVHKVDVRVPSELRVGLVPGVDDTAKTVLRAFLGKRLEVLDGEDLAGRPLDDLDTIVVDIRALRERARDRRWKAARAAFPRLLEFAQRGGRLVVLYHKDNEINRASAGIEAWPYPLLVGKGRVTREDAPVVVLDTDHVLLTTPNRILPEDWDGWVQERGLYFPSEYSPQYQEMLEMHDPGEGPLRGAMLYAPHGAGEYVYCALALYRQLNSLHPGACRVLANLVSRSQER